VSKRIEEVEQDEEEYVVNERGKRLKFNTRS
jgi:hypothetical protein